MSNGQRVSGYNIHTPVDSNWSLIGAGDFDNDGTDDILWQHSGGQVHAWEMSNGQQVSGHNIHDPVPSDWNLIGAGDFNNNGTDEILWQDASGQVFAWNDTALI